jgi:hypothetical protein
VVFVIAQFYDFTALRRSVFADLHQNRNTITSKITTAKACAVKSRASSEGADIHARFDAGSIPIKTSGGLSALADRGIGVDAKGLDVPKASDSF